MRFIFILTLLLGALYSAQVKEDTWPQEKTFLNFLEDNQLPLSLYYNMDEDDQTMVKMIYSGMSYHTLRDDNGKLLQALIPLTESLQISIYEANDAYHIDLVDIAISEFEESVVFTLENSILYDLKKITGNSKLALELTAIFNDTVDFRKDLRKGDKIAIIYTRKTRLGRTWGMPSIQAAFVETAGKRHYAFYDNDIEGFFDERARPIQGMFLRHPLRYNRISSPFTYKRWHPILRRYRPHFGVDYVAPRGTPIKTVAHGKVIFAGRKGGYGKTVIIQHKNGYLTKYAHLKGFSKRARRGNYVKQGEVIAYLGNTGMSTGPHLHFELRKNNKPKNPKHIKSIKKSGLSGKKRKAYLSRIAPMQEQLLYLAAKEEDGLIRLANNALSTQPNYQ